MRECCGTGLTSQNKLFIYMFFKVLKCKTTGTEIRKLKETNFFCFRRLSWRLPFLISEFWKLMEYTIVSSWKPMYCFNLMTFNIQVPNVIKDAVFSSYEVTKFNKIHKLHK